MGNDITGLFRWHKALKMIERRDRSLGRFDCRPILILMLLLVYFRCSLDSALLKDLLTGYTPVANLTRETVCENWQPVLTSVGSLEIINGVNVSSEVSGTIMEINFEFSQ